MVRPRANVLTNSCRDFSETVMAFDEFGNFPCRDRFITIAVSLRGGSKVGVAPII